MARVPVFLGVVALNLMHPAATLAAPTGGGMHHAAPALARPSSSGRSGGSAGENFKVPFDVDVRPRPLPGAQSPSLERWWPGLTERRANLWYVNPCLGSGASWGAPGLQATWTDELTMPGFTIGSLAGNANNLFSSKSSPLDAAVGSSNNAGFGSGSSLSFGYGPPASLCGEPGFGFQ